MLFPNTAEEFKTLKQQGKTVEYTTTANQQTIPDGHDWELWGMQITDTPLAVWRRIVDIELTE